MRLALGAPSVARQFAQPAASGATTVGTRSFTMEELLEVVTLRQLRLHRKPIVLLNVEGFWDPLLGLFDQFYRTRFSKEPPHSSSRWLVCRARNSVKRYPSDPRNSTPS